MQVGDVGVGVGAGGGRNAGIAFYVGVSVGGSGGVRHVHGGGNGEESGHGAACVHICMLTCMLCGICKHRFQSNISQIPKTCMQKSGLMPKIYPPAVFSFFKNDTFLYNQLPAAFSTLCF